MAFGLDRGIGGYHLAHTLERLYLGKLRRSKVDCFGVAEHSRVIVADQSRISICMWWLMAVRGGRGAPAGGMLFRV